MIGDPKLRTKVLLIDNDKDFLGAHSEYLRKQGGIDVTEAQSTTEAEAKLKDNWFHLALFDVKMENDSDDYDDSGIRLMRRVSPGIAKMVVSSRQTWTAATEVLRAEPGKKPLAIDYVGKDEIIKQGPAVLLSKVQAAISTLFNFELEINPIGTSLLCMISLLEGAPQTNEGLIEWSDELGDLFRKLFRGNTGITLFPLYFGRGCAVTMQVKTKSTSDEEKRDIVKCGLVKQVDKERGNYFQYVRRRNDAWSTQFVDSEETLHFGGLVYSIVGGDLDKTRRFSEFYRSRGNEQIQEVLDVLDHLFDQTCKIWYDGKTKPSTCRLDELYMEQLGFSTQQDKDGLKVSIGELRKEWGSLKGGKEIRDTSKGTTFLFASGEMIPSCPDVVRCLLSGKKIFPSSVPCCITHGDMNGNNVLVDEDGKTFLIDFERTGLGHIFRDFAELEGVIRWELILERNLESLYRFEQALSEPMSFEESEMKPPDKLPGDLIKALVAIRRLRTKSAQIFGGDIREYYMALLFYAARMIVSGGITSPGQGRPSFVRKAHAFLSAAMICKRLLSWNSWKGWKDDSPAPPIG